jgi:hypothetical protein
LEPQNELLDGWVGHVVTVQHLVGLQPTEKQARWMREDPATLIDRPLFSRTGFYRLEGYDQFGVTLRVIGVQEEDPPQYFVAWGAVLMIFGADRKG